MKRCPECLRDYYDDSLIYCLDDGAHLLEGLAPGDAPTAILASYDPSIERPTMAFDIQGTTNKSAPRTSDRLRGKTGIAIGAALLIVLIAGWAGYTYYRRGSSKQIESIAVMPFVNSGGHPEIEYLSDGLTEALINSLSKIPELSVKARSSVFSYKGKEVTPQQVATDLSVQAVLNGRIVQRGDQVVLNVELVDAVTGNQIWGDQYAKRVTDLVTLQSEIARDVSGNLRAKLTGAEEQKIARNHTENTEAYQLYLRGRHHWNKRNADDFRKSIEYFQQAIDKDPTYALAYASLAEAFILIANYRVGSPHEYYPKARAAAMKAIEIDESLAEAHNALATMTAHYDRKFAEAEREWQKSLALNPNYATAHQWYAEFLMSMGRFPEAVTEMRRAAELDPLSLIINGMLGIALMLNGEPEQALEQLQKTLEIDPNFPRTHLYLGEVYQHMGRYEEAIDEFGKHLSLSGAPAQDVADLTDRVRKAYRTGGPKAYARTFAEIIDSNKGPERAPAFVLAGYWAEAGEIDKAFAVLEKAFADHDDAVLSLKDPRLNPLKSDPRYKDLLRRVGLPE